MDPLRQRSRNDRVSLRNRTVRNGRSFRKAHKERNASTVVFARLIFCLPVGADIESIEKHVDSKSKRHRDRASISKKLTKP